jgi:hypothetical protein
VSFLSAETEARPVRKERLRNGRDTRFKPKNAGKPKGAKDRRRVLGQEAAAALEGRCWDVLEGLLRSSSWRARHEAAKTTLAYALGLPRQTLTISGGVGDLAGELARALADVRARRALPPVLDVEIVPDLLSPLEAANVEDTIQHSTAPLRGGNNTPDE